MAALGHLGSRPTVPSHGKSGIPTVDAANRAKDRNTQSQLNQSPTKTAHTCRFINDPRPNQTKRCSRHADLVTQIPPSLIPEEKAPSSGAFLPASLIHLCPAFTPLQSWARILVKRLSYNTRRQPSSSRHPLRVNWIADCPLHRTGNSLGSAR